MKKYIISILIVSIFLIGSPFVQKAAAADMTMRDFVNLLVAIGVITPDKMPAVNAFLANLDNQNESEMVSYKTYYLNDGSKLGPQFEYTNFMIKYPANWQYKEFDFNVGGIAFCPKSLADCGTQGGGGAVNATIILTPYRHDMTGAISRDSERFHVFKNQTGEILASISLSDIKYQKEFNNMVSSFAFILQNSITITSPVFGSVFSSQTATIPFSWTWSNVNSFAITPAMRLIDQNGTEMYGELGREGGLIFGTEGGSGIMPAPANLVIPNGSAQYRVQICLSVTDNSTCTNGSPFTINKTVTPQPSITVTSPNGGEQWVQGSTHNITWQDNRPMPTCAQSSGGAQASCLFAARYYKIYAWPEQPHCPPGWTCMNSPRSITSRVLGNSYSWNIDDFVGGRYELKVCAVGESAICDISDNYFTITAPTSTPATSTPSITVTSPNGGEQWVQGSTHNITWSSTGINNVTLELDKNSPNAGWQLAYSIPASAGLYSWTIPSSISENIAAGTDYKIRIWDTTNPSATDSSNNYFSLTAPVSPTSTLVNGACGTTENTCTAGTVTNIHQVIPNNRWSCEGGNGGRTAECSVPISGMENGVCGTTVNTCSAGIMVDVPDTTSTYKWTCIGTPGASDAACVKAKPAPTATCTWGGKTRALNTFVYDSGSKVCKQCTTSGWVATKEATALCIATTSALDQGQNTATVLVGFESLVRWLQNNR